MTQIHCPICRQRLFDAEEGDRAKIEIKCVRCGKVIKVELKESEIKTAAS